MARLMIGAGGTGGHVYPALSVAETLHPQNTHSLVFVGTRGGGGFERRLVADSQIPFDAFEEVFAGPIVGVAPLRALWSMLLLLVGTLQSLGLMLRYRPQALLLTGGWANVPIALAAWVFRVPMLIYLPDIEPGKTIQYLSKIATKVAITVPDSAQYFQAGQTVVTGYPLRASVRSATREAAQRHFGLDPQRQTLLVFGGSRGARSINQAVAALVPAFLADGLQIIHISGTLDAAEVATAKANLTHSSHYHVYDYLEQEMGLALAVADVVIARAGASTLGEFPYFGLPSILVPYPYAWRYQKTNADWLASRGAAVRLDDEKMSSELLSTVRGILEPPRYAAMQAAAQVLAQPHGTARLAQEFVQLTGEKA